MKQQNIKYIILISIILLVALGFLGYKSYTNNGLKNNSYVNRVMGDKNLYLKFYPKSDTKSRALISDLLYMDNTKLYTTYSGISNISDSYIIKDNEELYYTLNATIAGIDRTKESKTLINKVISKDLGNCAKESPIFGSQVDCVTLIDNQSVLTDGNYILETPYLNDLIKNKGIKTTIWGKLITFKSTEDRYEFAKNVGLDKLYINSDELKDGNYNPYF